jgi:hypothetical protein
MLSVDVNRFEKSLQPVENWPTFQDICDDWSNFDEIDYEPFMQ